MLIRTWFQTVMSSSSIEENHGKFPILQVSVCLCLLQSLRVLLSPQSQGTAQEHLPWVSCFQLPRSWAQGHHDIHHRHCDEEISKQLHQNISFIMTQDRPPRHIYHLPLLAPLDSEQKPITRWGKTVSRSIWDKEHGHGSEVWANLLHHGDHENKWREHENMRYWQKEKFTWS